MEPLKAHEARRRLEREGWIEERANKHHTFSHPAKPGVAIVVPKGRNPLSPGVMRQIAKVAEWKWPPR